MTFWQGFLLGWLLTPARREGGGGCLPLLLVLLAIGVVVLVAVAQR